MLETVDRLIVVAVTCPPGPQVGSTTLVSGERVRHDTPPRSAESYALSCELRGAGQRILRGHKSSRVWPCIAVQKSKKRNRQKRHHHSEYLVPSRAVA